MISGLYTSETSKKGAAGSLGATSNPAPETPKSHDAGKQSVDDFDHLHSKFEGLLIRRADIHTKIMTLRSEADGYLKDIDRYLSSSANSLPLAVYRAMLRYKNEVQATYKEKIPALSITESFDRREKVLEELSKSANDFMGGVASEHSMKYAAPMARINWIIGRLNSLTEESQDLDTEILDIFSKLKKSIGSALSALTGSNGSGATEPQPSSQ
ncbi:MAG TPA: hypothetical protein VMV00_03060 [Candidatus Baltobacteraceae bacterium]|nr:hypothetical protein [Candidatus Baltobacteraceae bacterium]